MTMIIAILEGANRDHFNKAARSGLAPWWTKNISDDDIVHLECGPAPYEPSNLATAFTGFGRGHHGCFSYWRMRHPEHKRPEILNSHDMKKEWIWNWPELQGLKKAVVNVQLTYPPQPLEGYLISYLMNQTLRYTYPADLAHQMAQKGIRYGHDVSAFYEGQGSKWLLDRTQEIAEYQLETALTLAEEVDLLVVNLTLIDRVSHFFWDTFENLDPQNISPLALSYAQVDASLAKLDLASKNDPMILFSEFSFGPIDGFISIDDHLQKAKLLQTDANFGVDGKKPYAREAPQGAHGIICHEPNINGSADNLIDETIDALTKSRDEGGNPIISSIWRSEEIYDGDYVLLAPDIIFEPADPCKPPLGDPRWAHHVNRHLQTGWHRNEGFATLIRGPRKLAEFGFTLIDVAPTIAALLGREYPSAIKGQPFGY